MNLRQLWPVFAAYVLAFVGIVACTLLAAAFLRALDPDLTEREVFEGLPGLLAGGVASSTALAVTVLVATRPLGLARLRLEPGRETGRQLGAVIVGTLALGQALDSLTAVVGLGRQGPTSAVHRALAGASGGELFAAVLVIGVMAGAAEEVFFRGYMQTFLAERLRPATAVVVTSACFGLMHLEWLHVVLAFVLGLYLGFVTERSGSALPAVAAHVVNNVLFTLLTATVGTVEAFWPNVWLLVASALVFGACAVWLSRGMPGPGPRPSLRCAG